MARIRKGLICLGFLLLPILANYYYVSNDHYKPSDRKYWRYKNKYIYYMKKHNILQRKKFRLPNSINLPDQNAEKTDVHPAPTNIKTILFWNFKLTRSMPKSANISLIKTLNSTKGLYHYIII